MKSATYIGSCNVEEIVRAEKERRRKARLLQVRHQAQEIATEVRKAVSAEKEFQLKTLENKIHTDFDDNKKIQLIDQQEKYSSCLRAIGAGHKNVPAVERRQQRKLELEKEASRTASTRGKSALKVQQKMQKETAECTKSTIRRKLDVRAKENERAAFVASLPAPPPDPLSEALSTRGSPPVFGNRLSSQVLKPCLRTNLLRGTTELAASPRTPIKVRSEAQKKTSTSVVCRDLPKSSDIPKPTKGYDMPTPKPCRRLLAGLVENVASPSSPSVHKASTSKQSKVQTSSIAGKENGPTMNSHENQFDDQNDHSSKITSGKVHVSVANRHSSRKFKGYVSTKINKRKSGNFSKRYSSGRRSSSNVTPKMEPADDSVFDNQVAERVPVITPSKEIAGQPMTHFLLNPILALVQHPENESQSLIKELEAVGQAEQRSDKMKDESYFTRDAAEKRQLLMERALEDIMSNTATSACSPQGTDTASLLNICRIEEEESAYSSPELALRHNLASCRRSDTNLTKTSAFFEDLISQGSPMSVTTSRRKFMDCAQYSEVTCSPQVTITTVVQKDMSQANQEKGITITTTVNQPDCFTAGVDCSQSVNSPRSTFSLPQHPSPDLNLPYLTRSPLIQIQNSASAYQQYITSQSDKLQSENYCSPVNPDCKNSNTPIQNTQLVHGFEEVKTSRPGGNFTSITKSKSLEPKFERGKQHTPENQQLVHLNSPATHTPKVSIKQASSVQTTQPTLASLNMTSSPEFTQVTPADTRSTLARVLASRKMPTKTNLEMSSVESSTPTQNLLPTPSSYELVTRTSEQQLPKSNLNIKPTWGQVLKESESNPLTTAKQTSLPVKDAKVQHSKFERRNIISEQQELIRQFKEFRQQQLQTAEKTDTILRSHDLLSPPVYNNDGATNYSFSDDASSGSNSPDNAVSSSEPYIHPRPPTTILRGMDRTPHELSTIWEADTSHSAHASTISNVATPANPYPAPPYFYKTKLPKLTSCDQACSTLSENFRIPYSSASPVLSSPVDSLQLASTPKKSTKFWITLLGDGPGIMEQSQPTLVDSELSCTGDFFTPPGHSPSKYTGINNAGVSSATASPNRQACRLVDDPGTVSSLASGNNQMLFAQGRLTSGGTYSPATPQISENSVTESLLSFERHELSNENSQSFSPAFHE